MFSPLRPRTFTNFPAVPVRNYSASCWHHEEKHELCEKNSWDICFFCCILLATLLPIFEQRVKPLKALCWVQARVVTAGFAEKHSFPPIPPSLSSRSIRADGPHLLAQALESPTTYWMRLHRHCRFHWPFLPWFCSCVRLQIILLTMETSRSQEKALATIFPLSFNKMRSSQNNDPHGAVLATVVVFVTRFRRITAITTWWRHAILFLTEIIITFARCTTVECRRRESGHASQRTAHTWKRSGIQKACA